MAAKPRFDGEWVRLGDVLRVVHGKNQKDVKDEDGKYPIYGSGGQMGWANSFICPANTVIIGRKGNINKPIYVTEPFWNVDTAFGLVAKPGLLDARFLFHFCKYFDFEKLNTTCTIPSLTRKNVESIGMFLPPFRTQKELAAQFDVILEIIVLARNQLSSLDALVKSRFAEMFGNANDIEEKWALEALIDCVNSIESGRSPKCQAVARKGTEPGVLKLSALSSGVFLPGENKAMCVGEKIESSKEVVRGDILVARKNTPELVGACAIVREEVTNLMFPDIVFRMHPKEDVNGDYLSALLSSPSYSAKVKSLAHGSNRSMSNIPKSELAGIPIPVPPLHLQQEFAAFVARVDKSRFIVQQQIEKLQMLYDSLAQEYFS
ncbi:restriction endonuclease subunit S [Collinsella tanakaei]|uniref:restriction endonuclease subunit S n=1 Tax=Collinsella tanakaei TaxID=626935 RepID=UPI0026EEA8E2|nr:restriction endonuclease subunit S [Collinsella tanakaei]